MGTNRIKVHDGMRMYDDMDEEDTIKGIQVR